MIIVKTATPMSCFAALPLIPVCVQRAWMLRSSGLDLQGYLIRTSNPAEAD